MLTYTILLFEELGFPMHYEKSVLVPAQIQKVWGFVLNSVTATVQLTTEGKAKLRNAHQKLVEKETCTTQNLAEVKGLIVSSLPGVEYGSYHY